jgi:hypothetical protein
VPAGLSAVLVALGSIGAQFAHDGGLVGMANTQCCSGLGSQWIVQRVWGSVGT